MIRAILACDDNWGIGKDGTLPWPHNKKDMKWFRDNTVGHVVVMGRKTWESFGSRPLPNRINVVISNNKFPHPRDGGPDHVLSGDLESGLKVLLSELYPNLKLWIIGGANIYRQALPFCDKLYITRIKGSYKCDTFMYNQDFDGFDVQEYIDADDDLEIQIRSRR